MVTDWVVDASVAVKLLAAEPDSEQYRAFVAESAARGRLLSTSLLRYEVGNALTKHGTVPGLEDLLAKGLSPIERIDPKDVAGRQHGLSYYDAAYLALAIQENAGLLTADDEMRKAAKKHGIPLWP